MKLIFSSIIFVLFFVGCQSVQTEKMTETKISEPEQSASVEEVVQSEVVENNSRAIQEFSVEVGQWYYSPNVIEVNEGDIVVITAKSVDVPHSFTLPDFNDESRDNGTGGISVLLQPGQDEVITFVADKKGEFVYGCDVVCGRGHTTMMGKLIVK